MNQITMTVYIYDLFQEDKLPYSFYILDKEFVVPLGTYLMVRLDWGVGRGSRIE